uniref:Secreted protein n=1 Tax=Romanomermis culicivorax TaxID=13658 RepID=A0A915HWK5_ROMCU
MTKEVKIIFAIFVNRCFICAFLSLFDHPNIQAARRKWTFWRRCFAPASSALGHFGVGPFGAGPFGAKLFFFCLIWLTVAVEQTN